MSNLSKEEIERIFLSSNDFNELFDAFENAIKQKIDDFELYQKLFWNSFLTIDEIILFGEKLVLVQPENSFEIFFWMANIFEALYSEKDNLEHAFNYYKKASIVKPTSEIPFIKAFESFDQDLNLPPIDNLIDFLKNGVELVYKKGKIYKHLGNLYKIKGDPQHEEYYYSKAAEFGEDIN